MLFGICYGGGDWREGRKIRQQGGQLSVLLPLVS
jgi:hypothetical protein